MTFRVRRRDVLSESRMRRMRTNHSHVRFDEEDVETE